MNGERKKRMGRRIERERTYKPRLTVWFDLHLTDWEVVLPVLEAPRPQEGRHVHPVRSASSARVFFRSTECGVVKKGGGTLE